MNYNFSNKVLSKFKFLTCDYGFQCTVQSTSTVRFENYKLFIEISFDFHRSYELSCIIGEKKDCSIYFSINEILNFLGGESSQSLKCIQITDLKILDKFLNEYSSAIKKDGDLIFLNSLSFFNKLKTEQNQNIINYSIETKMKHINLLASQAWKERDFSKIVKLCEPVKEYLSKSSLKKLNFSQRKLKDCT